jgi:SAM-dependent methyltransferase
VTAPFGTPQERTGGLGLYFLLGRPGFYSLFQKLAWTRFGNRFFNEFTQVRPREKVLDIGCGPGERLKTLPEVSYTGFDLNPRYIESAKHRHGAAGRFFCGDVAEMSFESEEGTYDLVLAHGILHHIDDQRARNLFALARAMLKSGGRLVTVDPCYCPGQSRAAHWVVSRDRGKFVRETGHYLRLASSSFSDVTSIVRHDLLRIPYSQILLRCRR